MVKVKPVKESIQIGEHLVEVTYKRMKSLRLKFNRKTGVFTVSAPLFLSNKQVVEFLESKKHWINTQEKEFDKSPKRLPLCYSLGEKHWFLGEEYELDIREVSQGYGCSITPSGQLVLQVPVNSTITEREAILYQFYRNNMKTILPKIIEKWEGVIGVKSSGFLVRKMKTRWGTCNIQSKRITINLELIKHPKINIEHVVVHELVHLLERGHTKRFYGFLTQFQPGWEEIDADIKKRGLEC